MAFHRRFWGLLCLFIASLSTFIIFEEFQHLDSVHNEKALSNSLHHYSRNGVFIDGTVWPSGNKVKDHNVLNTYNSMVSIAKFVPREEQGEIALAIPNLSGNQREKELSEGVHSKPEYIVILAQMRTGSSIVGQIFNQNKNVFYLYEPLHVIQNLENHGFGRHEVNPTVTQILRNISECTFSSQFIKSFGSWGGRTKSRALMPLCKRKDVCMNLKPDVLKQICASFNGRIAMKVIRAGLHHFKSLVEDHNINVKFIHLVRDPRGTANSRLEYYKIKGIPLTLEKGHEGPRYQNIPGVNIMHMNVSNRNMLVAQGPVSNQYIALEKVLKTLPVLCHWMSTAFDTALARPAWLRGRYMLVRYEDFADKPVPTTIDIYKFLGYSPPEEVLEWIRKNTNDDNADTNYTRNPLFSMHKNASAVASRWRLRLHRTEVDLIQNVCANAMDLLGYKRLEPSDNMLDLSCSLLKPFNMP